MKSQTESKEISYSEDDVNSMAASNRLSDGWYKFKVEFPSSGVNKNSGNYFVKFVCMPLRDPKDLDSGVGPTVQNNWILPISNPKTNSVTEGKIPDGTHKAPNTAGICHNGICAIYSDHPRMPKKGEDSQYYSFAGELLEDYEQVEVEKLRVSKLTLDKLVSLYRNDGDDLEGRTFFGLVGTDASGEFVNIKKMTSALPEGEKLVDPKNFTTKKTKSAPATEEKPNTEVNATPKRRR